MRQEKSAIKKIQKQIQPLTRTKQKESLPSNQIQQQLILLALYRLPQICETLSSLEQPNKWDLQGWADRIDNLVQKNNLNLELVISNSSDYLVDLYHFKEICRLFSLTDIKTLKQEFTILDENGLMLEEFVLLILKIIRVDEPQHTPFVINGIQQLYKVITKKYKQTKISFDVFLNYYVVEQLITSLTTENDYIQMEEDKNADNVSQLKQFEELKKSKYGFFSSKTQDVVHHDNSIKTVQFAEEFNYLFSLDEQSDYFRVYNSVNLTLIKRIQTDSPKHQFKPIRLIDIFWSDAWKTLGACCQDKSISFWQSNFKSEFCYSCKEFGIQLKIYYLLVTQTWITVNQFYQIIEWRFITQEKGGQNQKSSQKISKMDSSYDETPDNNEGPGFTHSSIAEGKVWGFKTSAKISFIKEIPAIKKLMIATFDRKITVWTPNKNSIFVTIDIPDGFSSSHTVAFSQKMNLIFSAGFDQGLLIWALDEINQDYNKIGKIEVSEAGVSVSAIDCFDEYGLLVTIDESGMIRCWDIEKWRMAYRFNLGCKIKNTISSIIKLEMGRFIIVTSRLHMFEFPVKHARKIKSKFQPLKQMSYNPLKNHLTIASQKELYCFNINNAIVEQKYNLENSTIVPQMNWFLDCVMQNNLYTVDNKGFLIWLDHKGDKANDFSQEFKFYQQTQQEDPNKKIQMDHTATRLFENTEVCGLNYHQSYDLICVWTATTVRIYRGSLVDTQQSFQQIRQITFKDMEISVAKCLPERDIIGVLLKGGIVVFRSFSNLAKLGQLHISQDELLLELQDFHFVTNYDALIVFDGLLNLWFFRVHGKFKSFQCIVKILSNSLFMENVLYKNASHYFYDKLSLHQQHHPIVQKIINTFMETKQNLQNAKFYEDLGKVNKDPFYNDEEEYGILYKFAELEKQKRYILKKMTQKDGPYRSLRVIFKDSVMSIMSALRDKKNDNNKTFLTQPKKPNTRSLQSNFTQRPSEQWSSFSDHLKQEEEPQLDVPTTSNSTFNIQFILEDFQTCNYLTLTNPRGQIIILGIQDLLEQNFTKDHREYANKQIYSKLYCSVQETTSITHEANQVQILCDSLNLLKQSGIHILQFNAHDKSEIIETQMVSLNGKLYLFSFGVEDNSLKAWNISQLEPQLKVDIDPTYLQQKSKQVRVIQKLQDLQSNQGIEDISDQVSDLKQQIITLKTEIKSLISVQKLKQQIIPTQHLLEGEYILPIESKIRWTLKETNSAYRVDQMKETKLLLQKMLFRWQQANKHQQNVLQIQIHDQQSQYESRQVNEAVAIPNLLLKSPNQKGKSKFFFQRPMMDDFDRSRSGSLEQNFRGKSIPISSRREDSQKKDESNERNSAKLTKLNFTEKAKILPTKDSPKQPQTPLSPRKANNSKIFPNHLPQLLDISQTTHTQIDADSQYGQQTLTDSIEEKLKTYHARTIDLNKRFNEIYYPGQERPQPQRLKEKKKRGKYEVDLLRIQEVFGDQPQLLKINQLARSSEKMKYLMKYRFKEMSQNQLDSVTTLIKQNRSIKVEQNSLAPNKQNHYLNYFLKDAKQPNDEYFSNVGSGEAVLQGHEPRQNLFKRMDQLLRVSKNSKNTYQQVETPRAKDKDKDFVKSF